MMRTGKSHAGRVNLTKYVKMRGTASETWRFCPVVRSSNGRIRPDYVLIDAKPELHKEGAYYIEWYLEGRRYRESVGKNPSEAFATAERKAQILKNRALGIEIVGEDKQIGVTLAEACREFLEETRQHHRPKTYSQYKTALEYFRQSCREKPLCGVERSDLMTFMGFLSDKGLARRTIWTKVQVIVSMLKANGVTKLIRKRDWPRYTETEPEVYAGEEVERFLAQCNSWKRVLFEFFWRTGFREGEVMHVTWPDIDFGNHVVRVKAKPKLGFIPKDWEEREVPIPNRLLNSLRHHKATVSANHAPVFATSNGGVVHNFLRQCKSVAWRAGLNCGLCDTGQGHCAKGPYCRNWLPYLHQALLAYGHPEGLHVTLLDADVISPTNCVRQPFSRSEVGLYKSVVLANRLNLFWGLDWAGHSGAPRPQTKARWRGHCDWLCRHAEGSRGNRQMRGGLE